LFYKLRRQPQEAQEQAEQALALCAEWGILHMYAAIATGVRTWALVVQGQNDPELLARLHAAHGRTKSPGFPPHLAELYGQHGRAAEGLGLLDETFKRVETTGEIWALAEWYRTRGELVLALQEARPEEAERCFQRALDLARQQQARMWELRAAVSLSRLWQRQGKRPQARQLLARVCDWFTEGFDTPDLQAARTLLETL
jgi:predicted ATPase